MLRALPIFCWMDLSRTTTRDTRPGCPSSERRSKRSAPACRYDEELRWHWVAGIVARHVWDDERWHALSERHVQLARSVGALSELPVALNSRAFMLLFAGDLTAAAALIQELQPAIEATGTRLAPYAALGLAVLSGRSGEATALIEAITRDVTPRGEGIGLTVVDWAHAVLNNGLGNYQEALTAAARSTGYLREMTAPTWAMAELIEAAARSGHGRCRRRRPRSAGRDDQRQRHRLGARHRGSIAGASKRGRHRGASLS